MITEEEENYLYRVGNKKLELCVYLEVGLIKVMTFSLHTWFAITVKFVLVLCC
jgi:hypothetical protein